ncbi:hypothetical protein OG399_18930 [Streptomyces achromogenes]
MAKDGNDEASGRSGGAIDAVLVGHDLAGDSEREAVAMLAELLEDPLIG